VVSHVTEASLALDYRRDQQVFGTRVERRLHDVDFAPQALRRSIGERRFADAGLAEQPRCHGHVVFMNHEPGSLKLAHQLVLADPADGNVVRVGEVQSHTFQVDRTVYIGKSAAHTDYSILALRGDFQCSR
jgi:hypothetical protein